MAFIFACTSSNNAFTIALKDTRTVQAQFAVGYAKAKLISFAASNSDFHQTFFADKPAAHALIADIALNGRNLFTLEDLDTISEAIVALRESNMIEHPVYGILDNAKVQINTRGICAYNSDVVALCENSKTT